MYMFQFHVWSKNAKSRRYPSCLESVILEIASRLKINYRVNEFNQLLAVCAELLAVATELNYWQFVLSFGSFYSSYWQFFLSY